MGSGRRSITLFGSNPTLPKENSAYINLPIRYRWGEMLGKTKQVVAESPVETESGHSALHSRDSSL